MDSARPAADFEKVYVYGDDGQVWITSWHPGSLPPPDGRRHGSAGICIDPAGQVIVISMNGTRWELPGGRPEGNEDWRETLVREMLEEGCATVNDATLLGYSRGECIEGHEKGLILIRSLWRAEVTAHPWDPKYEVLHRLLLPPDQAMAKLTLAKGRRPIVVRWFQEALAVQK
ncbi:MAG: NUDIX domain-containing protein [SAR202 cluster bacterium]|nr:NUDIX domain-containing protein [SAR202 cluster bacterium]